MILLNEDMRGVTRLILLLDSVLLKASSLLIKLLVFLKAYYFSKIEEISINLIP